MQDHIRKCHLSSPPVCRLDRSHPGAESNVASSQNSFHLVNNEKLITTKVCSIISYIYLSASYSYKEKVTTTMVQNKALKFNHHVHLRNEIIETCLKDILLSMPNDILIL